VLVGLQFVNWLLEAIKFKLLISIEKIITLKTALKAVYVGNFTAFFTPDRLGTFIGRIFILKGIGKLKITALTAVGNLSQLIVTISFGLLALFCLTFIEHPFSFIDNTMLKAFQCIFFILLIVVMSIYMNPSLLFKILGKVKYFNSYILRLAALKNINFVLKLKVLWLSFLRFLVFYSQYVLIIKFLSIDFNTIDCLIFVGLLYGIVTFIPSPFLGNFGTREALALYLTSATAIGVLGPFISFSVWLINVGISTIIGGVILSFNKMKTN
jgi:hypothetical protein